MSRLTHDQLSQLQYYKHSSSGVSLLDPYLQPFWKWLASYFPQRISLNIVSVSALSISITTSFLLIYFCPTATANAPSWVLLTNAIGLFLYHTLDAIKQVHYVSKLSPLSELLNQGCHSITVVIEAIAVSIAMELCNHPWVMALFCLMSYVAFYCDHWCAYIKGESHIERFDVTEIHLLTVFLFSTSAVFGSSVWSRPMPIFGCPWYIIPVMFYILSSTNSMRRVVFIIIDGGCGENGATIADTSVISPIPNIILIVILALSIECQQHPILFLLFIGVLCAKVTNLLVIAHSTRSEIHWFDRSLALLLVIVFNQYLDSFVDEYLLLWCCFLLTVVDLVHYLTQIYNEIACYLRINIFSASPMPQATSQAE